MTKKFSVYLLPTLFFFTLILFSFYIEFFYSKNQIAQKNHLLDSPLKSDFIDRVSTIKISNKIGNFLLIKKNNFWHLEGPKKFTAREETVEKILNSFKNIHIRTIHANDKINFSNFSLDSPLAQITLLTKLEETTSLQLGLINPVTNNTYLFMKNANFIYEIAQINFPFERLEFVDLIDTRVFNFEKKNIQQIDIYLYDHKEARTQLTFNNNLWESKRFRHISQDKIASRIEQILSLSPYQIIDSQEDNVEEFLAQYLKSPKYTVHFILKDQTKIKAKVSRLTQSFDPLKIGKREYFVIEVSNRPYPFLVSKEFLDIFLIQYKEIK